MIFTPLSIGLSFGAPNLYQTKMLAGTRWFAGAMFHGRNLDANHGICTQFSYPQLQSRATMAAQAERADILEIALTAAFNDGNDVVGIPETFARPATQSPVGKERVAVCATRIT